MILYIYNIDIGKEGVVCCVVVVFMLIFMVILVGFNDEFFKWFEDVFDVDILVCGNEIYFVGYFVDLVDVGDILLEMIMIICIG